MCSSVRTLALASLLSICSTAAAEPPELELHGHAKYQISRVHYGKSDLQSILGVDRVTAHTLDLRAASSASYESFIASFDLEALGAASDAADPEEPRLEQPLPPGALSTGRTLIDDRTRLFDLTAETDDDELAAVLRADRLSAGYVGQSVVFIAGRQAVSWGGGIGFQVIDLFNPFTPTAIDKDYKTGADMIYGQYLFSDGGDLQALAVGRRDPVSEKVLSSESSYAAKWRTRYNDIDVDLLAAEHYDEPHAGFAVALPVKDGVLRIDGMAVETAQDGSRFSFLTNYDRSWTAAGLNMYGYVEYFRNAFGSGSGDYSNLSSELTERILREELFTLGRDYLNFGLRIELTARCNWYSSAIANLHDESGIAQTRAVFDAAQDVQLMAGFDVPWGARGTEFGGLPLARNSYLGLGWDMYLRLSYYF